MLNKLSIGLLVGFFVIIGRQGACDDEEPATPGFKTQDSSIFRIEFPIKNLEPMTDLSTDTDSGGPSTADRNVSQVPSAPSTN